MRTALVPPKEEVIQGTRYRLNNCSSVIKFKALADPQLYAMSIYPLYATGKLGRRDIYIDS